MSDARRTDIAITWESIDISKDIRPHLVGLSYGDNLTSTPDDLTIDVEDRDRLWAGDWKPEFGDVVLVRITATPWLTDVKSLRLGTFAHDKISLSGWPRRASIKAISAPLATGLRRRKRNRAWRGVTLFQIASDIADRAGINLDWIGGDGLTYKNREQKDKSDLEFLDELLKEVGRDWKIAEDTERDNKFTLYVFREQERDAVESIGDLDLDGGHVLGYTFDSDDSGRYGSCHLKFFDPRTGKTHEAEFPEVGTSDDARRAMGLDPEGQSLEVKLAVDDRAHAIEICKGRLRSENRFANRGHLSVTGDCGLVAGVTFDLVNANAFNGKYIITKAEHKVTDGYTCNLEVRRCVEGY